jgi:hypothetical protein
MSAGLVAGPGAGSLRGFLERFRRSAGVPEAAAGELESELAPLFAALDALDRDAAEIRDRVRRREAERAAAAGAEVEERLQAARDSAARERARVAERARGAAAAEAASIAAEAAQEAARIAAAGHERLPALVEAVVGCVEKGSL